MSKFSKFLKKTGKAISSGLKSVGKALSKAAPILIPFALTGGLGSLGGLAGSGGLLSQASKSLFGASNLGGVGQKLLSGLGKNFLGDAVKGGIVKSVIPGASGLVDPDAGDAGGEGQQGGNAASNNFIEGFAKMLIPTLLTEAIEGKPKSAEKKAEELYANAPTTTPLFNEMSSLAGDNLKYALANPVNVSPLSTYSPLRSISGANASQRKEPSGTMNNLAATQMPSRLPGVSQPAPVLQASRRKIYGADAEPNALMASLNAAQTNQILPEMLQPVPAPQTPLAPMAPALTPTGGEIGAFAAPVAPGFGQGARPRGFAVRRRV